MEKKKDPIIETIASTFIPTHLGQRCPVCNGFGTLKYGEIICQACSGKGYILVPAIREKYRKEYYEDLAK